MVVISETMRGCQLDAIRIESKLAKHSQNSTKIEGRGANRRERGSGQALTLAKKKKDEQPSRRVCCCPVRSILTKGFVGRRTPQGDLAWQTQLKQVCISASCGQPHFGLTI